MSKIEKRTENLPVAISELERFKAMYYALKGKRDTEIKLFDDDRTISKADIIDLNDKIQGFLRTQHCVTNITTITVNLKNGDIKDFGTWNQFIDFDWNIGKATHSIVIEWDFNIVLPNQKEILPLPHSVRIRMGSGLRPNEFFQIVMSGGEDHEIQEAQADLVCKVDYVNTAIASGLIGEVTKWYESLEKIKPETASVKYAIKHRVKIKEFVKVLFILSALIFLDVLWVKIFFHYSVMDFTLAFSFIGFSILIFYVFYKSGELWSNRVIEKYISELKKKPIFCLTKGDINKKNSTLDSNAKIISNLRKEILISILLNGLTYILGLITSYILKLFV